MIIPIGDEIILPEIWYDLCGKVIEYDIAPYYEISTWGRIKNFKTGNIIPQNINYDKNHYITVMVHSISEEPIHLQIHRLLMMRLNPIGNSYLYDINHKDGIKYHNWIWNLEWVTHKDNMKHAVDNNLFKYGINHPNGKFTNEQIETICKYISEGKGASEINSLMNIPNCSVQKTVQNIKNGHCHRKIAEKYNII